MYLFKVKHVRNRRMCEIFSKRTIHKQTPESLLLTLNMYRVDFEQVTADGWVITLPYKSKIYSVIVRQTFQLDNMVEFRSNQYHFQK